MVDYHESGSFVLYGDEQRYDHFDDGYDYDWTCPTCGLMALSCKCPRRNDPLRSLLRRNGGGNSQGLDENVGVSSVDVVAIVKDHDRIEDGEMFEASKEQIELLFSDERSDTVADLLALLKEMSEAKLYLRVNGGELKMAAIYHQLNHLNGVLSRYKVCLVGETDYRWSSMMHSIGKGQYSDKTAQELCTVEGRDPNAILLRMLGVIKRELLKSSK